MSASAPPNRVHAFTRLLFEALRHAGVFHVCIAPGSRSTPLVAGAVATPGLELSSHVDERAAGFFALGHGRRTGRPAAVVCTSGTAVANLLPAACEAHHARVPLLLLTADRPPELRGWGAPQTLDQVGIYGTRVRWSEDVPPPDAPTVPLRHARAVAARAVAAALGPPAGPVHLNLPFREPLAPVAGPEPARDREQLREWEEEMRATARMRGSSAGALAPDPAAADELAHALRASARGLLVAGPLPHAPRLAAALRRLARAARQPLVADALAGVRSGADVKDTPLVTTADAWLRDPGARPPAAPDHVLRFGDPPTSRALREWLAAAPRTDHALVDPDGVWADPEQVAGHTLRCDPALLAEAVAERLERDPSPARPWCDAWVRAEAAARRAAELALAAEGPLWEPAIAAELGRALPEDATLFVSNSMPVRDVDTFLAPRDRTLRILGQRGVNGIDGVTSAALGAAAAGPEPLVLLTGDVAFLHDLGGLLAAPRNRIRATLVVVNNDGGGIFSLLPIANHREAVAFETHVASAHGRRFRAAAELFELDYAQARTASELRGALERSLASERTTVVEVPVPREAGAAARRALWARMADAAAAAWRETS